MLDFGTMRNRDEALERALEAAGGPSGLAKALGISKQAIGQWDEVPPLKVLAVEQVTGVSRHELRPDLYPVPEPAEARA